MEKRASRLDAIHFCHVRFLWRFAFKRFLRLCLFIFRRRFFFRLPMVECFREGAPCARPAMLSSRFYEDITSARALDAGWQ
jgi:hypothetical protein